MKVSPLQKKVLEQISINPNLSITEYAKIIGSTHPSVKTAVQRLREGGVLDNSRVSLGRKAGLSITEEYAGEHKALNEECESKGIPIQDVNHYWYKGEHFSIHLNNPNGGINLEKVRDDMIGEMKRFAPKYPVIKRRKQKDEKLLIVDAADPHFGKRSTIEETGEETNLLSTEKRFAEGIEGLINKTDSYKFEKIVLIGGNDSLHTDNPFSTTTAGTKQDTAGMWYESFLSAKKANILAIDRLLTVADVHFVFCPSNHDFMTGFFLADTLKSWYSKNKNITFDVTPIHRKYIQYGHNLIGATHGDGAKEIELSDLMKTEAKKAWAQSLYAYWLVHHRHHSDTKGYKNGKGVKMEKDYKNLTVFNTGLSLEPSDYCFVQYVRSISGTDRWHFTNGFAHSHKAMEAFIFDPMYGQTDKITHLF